MEKDRKYITVGDEVVYRGSWGTARPKKVKIEGIEKTKEEGSKRGGIPVKKIAVDDITFGIFDLSDGHWCYGYQIVI